MALPPKPSRGPIQLPKPGSGMDPQIRSYLDNLVRAIETQLNLVSLNNNENSLINPEATYSVSIAGNTASATKIRDFTFTVINALKANRRIN